MASKKKVKVRFLATVAFEGKLYRKGERVVMAEEKAKALGSVVKIVK